MIVKDSVLYGDFMYLKIEKKFKEPTATILFENGKHKVYNVSDLMANS